MRRLFLLTVLTAILCGVPAYSGSDGDGIPDALDNCVAVANGPSAGSCFSGGVQVDTDGDGYGNPCDGDFDNDEAVNSNDAVILQSDQESGTSTPGSGTDMNCDGVVDSKDAALFAPQIGAGEPGP